MPVAEQNSVNSYTGNGVTTTFPYTFKVFAAADLKVTVDGALQTLNVHYSVTGAGDAGGGNVVFVNPPDNASHNPLVIVYRDLSYKRDTDYVESGDMLASTFDNDLDRLVMLIQQLKSDRDRAIKFPKGETADQVLPAPATRANRAVGFDASGAMVMLVPTTDGLSTILSQANDWTPLLQTNLNADKVDGIDAATLMAGRKNLIINGDFRVQQEGTSKTGISVATYFDMAQLTLSSSGTWSLAYDTSSLPTDQSGYALKATVTAQDATVNANDNARLKFAIEGYDYLALYKKAQTLSFWVKSNKTGTYCIALRNGTADRSYVAEYTVAQADTWEKKSLTIPTAPLGGTWNFTNGIGLDVQFALVAGSALHTTAGAWQNGNYYATANQVNLADTLNNYIAIADVQLEAGAAATDFERRPHAANLALVQRYLEKSYDPATPPGTATDTGAIVFVDPQVGGATTITFAVTKRAAPTVTIYNPTTGASGSYRDVTSGADFVASVTNVGVSNAHLGFAGHGAADETLRFHYVADARL